MRYYFLPHMGANIKCVLFQCLPYLCKPCFAMLMCSNNQASFIASGWVDQKGLHSLFFFCLHSPFHAVICAKGRIKATLPASQPSLCTLVKDEKLGGQACFRGKGIAGFTLRSKSLCCPFHYIFLLNLKVFIQLIMAKDKSYTNIN